MFYKIWKLVVFWRFQRHIWSTRPVIFGKLCLMTLMWYESSYALDVLFLELPKTLFIEMNWFLIFQLIVRLLLVREAGIWLIMTSVYKSSSDILMREGVLHQHSEICKALGFICWFCLEVELGKKKMVNMIVWWFLLYWLNAVPANNSYL